MMTSPIESVIQLFQVYERPNLRLRYNIRPGEPEGTLVMRQRDGKIHPDRLKWGFRPDGKKSFAPVNAKAETLFEKWLWKYAARHRRGLIPMDGFYEPKGPKGRKNRPQFCFRFPDERLFLVAGIWTKKTEASPLDTFSLVTTSPNSLVQEIHERMPAIVEPDAYEVWLSDTEDVAALRAVLRPWAGDALECWEVDRHLLNDVDDERCIAPLAA